jgi:hypothetical protein
MKIHKITSPSIPNIFAFLSYPKKIVLQWLVLSQEGIANTTGIHVSYNESPPYSHNLSICI